MKRSIGILLTLGLGATPALAQQPLEPQPGYQQPADSYGQQYGQPAAQPQYDPYAQPPQYAPQPQLQQPMDDDDDDDGYDVTYDISTSEDQYDDGYDANAYTEFESTLSPYGDWEDVPSYGHVWIPSTTVVGADFSPYSTGGQFVMSDYGWTWESDWDWGWAPFHYGRWMVIGGHGWCWIPGRTWGPAWVDWRFGGGYVGWAPMAPRGVVIGPPRGIRSPWRFTTAAQLGTRRPSYLPARVVPSVWSHTAYANNAARVTVGGAAVRVNAGPSARVVAQAVGHPIVPVALHQAAPRALPRATIVPRAGMPLANRPWIQSRPIGGAFAHPAPGARTLGTFNRPAPTVAARAYATPYRAPNVAAQPYRAPYQQPYRAPNVAAQPYRAPYQQPYRAPYQQPYRAPNAYYGNGYRAPQAYRPAPAPQPYHYGANAYHPMYSAPAQRANVYGAPAYHPTYSAPAYHAPVYSAPAHFAAPQHFSAPSPSFHSAPSYSAPRMSAPSFHGGGGFGGGGFRGGGRR